MRCCIPMLFPKRLSYKASGSLLKFVDRLLGRIRMLVRVMLIRPRGIVGLMGFKRNGGFTL